PILAERPSLRKTQSGKDLGGPLPNASMGMAVIPGDLRSTESAILGYLADRVPLLLVRALHPGRRGAAHHGPRYSRVLGFEPPEIVGAKLIQAVGGVAHLFPLIRQAGVTRDYAAVR